MPSSVARIYMHGGAVALCDIEDAKTLDAHVWHAISDNRTQYAQAIVREGRVKKSLLMHRLVLPNAAFIDHINHNGLDNRKCNLREVTRNQNQFNSRPRIKSSSRFKGVQRFQNLFRVAISRDNGAFRWSTLVHDETLAARVYDVVASRLFGSHAYLNFPESLELSVFLCSSLPAVLNFPVSSNSPGSLGSVQ